VGVHTRQYWKYVKNNASDFQDTMNYIRVPHTYLSTSINSHKLLFYCLITVTVYTICGTNIPHVSLHYMFRPDGAIFRYTGGLQSPVSLSATLPTLASVYIGSAFYVWSLYALCCDMYCLLDI
jgi:hypothetical protein